MSLRLLLWVAGAAVAALVVGALARGLGHPMPAPPSSVVLVGKPAPALTIRTLDGSTVSVKALRGRPVVLNVWASWCTGCRQEAPALDARARSAGPAVQFLGVDIQDSPSAARSFESEVKDPYPVGTVVGGDWGAYRASSPPQTFFIDAQGLIVAHFVGPLDGPALSLYMGRLGG